MSRDKNRSGDAGALSEAEMVGELIRRAGPRSRTADYQLDGVKEEAIERWERLVARRRRRQRGRRVTTSVLALAATLAFAAVALRWLGPAAGSPAGIVERVVDVLRHGDGADTATLAAGDPIASRSRLATGSGGGAAVRLASGVRFRLDRETEVRVLAVDRLRLVAGTVYVDATGAAESDYLDVETDLGTARDVGTVFQVRQGAAEVAVAVREGRVEVRRQGESWKADAGQQMRLAADGSVETSPIALADPRWRWALETAPGFELEGATLGSYLDWLRRETGWWVRFEGGDRDELLRTPLHGSLEGIAPDKTIELVLPGCGLDYAVEGGTLILRPEEALTARP